MYPREQLQRCLRCKHNIECWQIDNDIEVGLNEKEQAWELDNIIKNIQIDHVEHGAETVADYVGMMFINAIATLNKSILDMPVEYKRNAISNPLFVLCAMANTSNDGWECSGEFIFEER